MHLLENGEYLQCSVLRNKTILVKSVGSNSKSAAIGKNTKGARSRAEPRHGAFDGEQGLWEEVFVVRY
jgi:hypothetical protein